MMGPQALSFGMQNQTKRFYCMDCMMVRLFGGLQRFYEISGRLVRISEMACSLRTTGIMQMNIKQTWAWSSFVAHFMANIKY
jgi:hypothetical protein